MLTYNLENRGETPLYIYLYERIKADIESGAIRPDEKLPSRRTLAEHLKVSVLTVQNAYAQLLSEGYLYTRPKSGCFASALEGLRAPAPAPQAEPREPAAESRYFLDFCDNSISLEQFPFSVWSKQMREVIGARYSGLLRPTPGSGAWELRQAIAGFLHRFRGMSVSPDRIIVGAGTEYLYGLLVKLLGKDAVYAVEDPGYRKIAAIYRSEGVDCRPVPLDAHGLSAAMLARSGADIVHISPSHHFPTGIVMPIKRRQELLNWAGEREGRYIIEDDYDSEFRFTGKAVPTMQSIDTRDRVIYVNTFSKTISPAIRISYMILPPLLLKKYREELSFYSCTVSGFEQYTLARFIESGGFERHINRMRKAYRLKRDFIIRAIKSGPLGKMAEIREENAGLHFLLKLDTALSDREIVRCAAEKGIKLSCLSEYYYDRQLSEYYDRQDGAVQGMVILNYSGVDTAHLEKGMEMLAEIVGQKV